MNGYKIFRTILISIIVICLGYVAFYYINAAISQNKNDKLADISAKDYNVKTPKTGRVFTQKLDVVYLGPEVLEKYKTLHDKNKNLIGWIKIADTNIDYPVVQSVNGNGEFYLDHDFDGKEDRNGTLFMDDKCDAKLPSDNLIIYGHNMKSGKMFGELTQYKSEKFYERHKKIFFDTIYDEGTYEVMYAFNSHIYSEGEIAFKYYQFIEPNSEEEFKSAMKSMAELSIYDTGVSAEWGDDLLTLSTCDYDESQGRFVVVAKKVN